MYDICREADAINEQLARYGVKFGIYKNNEFKEQLFPFDAIPRVITAEEFAYLEKGLQQRVTALNCFLADVYSDKKIIKDGVIPPEFIYSSSGYLAECEGVKPPKGIGLSKGSYDAQIAFAFYHKDTGEKGMVDSTVPIQIKIK